MKGTEYILIAKQIEASIQALKNIGFSLIVWTNESGRVL
jgi:hypothetical protein